MIGNELLSSFWIMVCGLSASFFPRFSSSNENHWEREKVTEGTRWAGVEINET